MFCEYQQRPVTGHYCSCSEFMHRVWQYDGANLAVPFDGNPPETDYEALLEE